MHEMTAANLRSAFGGESMAHMRYKVWGDAAEKEGFANVARLFRAISFAEESHARGHFRAMKDVAGAFGVSAGGGFGDGTTSENLAGADIELGRVQICSNCGHMIEGDAPDVCPICNVKKQMYHEFA